MRSARYLAWLIAAMLAPALARADTMVAVRPGLMCHTAKALALLTLPDGASRLGTPLAHPGDAALARKGGCLAIPKYATVTVEQRETNTSIIRFDPGDGTGRRNFFVANIDFALRPLPSVNPSIGQNFALFSNQLAAQCPGRHWGRATNAAYQAPLKTVIRTMSAPAVGAMNQYVGHSCPRAGGSCENEVTISFLVHFGRLQDLANAFCNADPTPQ